MKKILVPTDFSPVADNAMLYAIEIAALFNSELHLYHSYSFDRFNYNLDYPDNQQPYIKEVEQKMKRAALKFRHEVSKRGLSLNTIVERGSILSLFQSRAQEYGIDLIVMGTKGASGLEKVVFGSVATMAVEISKVPVLAVPPGYTYQSLKHLTLAVDHKELSKATIEPLKIMADKCAAAVTLLNVTTRNKKQAFQEISQALLEGIEVRFREVPLTKSINESINEFVKEQKCDLLYMIRREKGFFDSFFKRSTTKEQVFNSQAPVIILPEK
jgi:nucleotide-binding universal stress UspA family protein